MTPQKQPSPWSCLPTAFAIVMSVDVDALMLKLGHDDEQGFHPQELQWLALRDHGWAFVPFDVEPEFMDGFARAMERPALPNLSALLARHSGVLTGMTKQNKRPHAVAWCHETQRVFDPNFDVYGIERFEVESFLVGTRVR